MQRSPPATRSHTDKLDERLKEKVKCYRRYLQKISRLKTKILCALRDEGVPEACELLQTPTREVNAVRCGRCVGCHTLQTVGPCFVCPECASHQECAEHTRLCFAWRQPSATFVGGSVVTGVSSVCNAKDYDITKYKELMDLLGEASLDIEGVLDDFPHGTNHHHQDRFNASQKNQGHPK